jgi:hypothetical protein
MAGFIRHASQLVIKPARQGLDRNGPMKRIDRPYPLSLHSQQDGFPPLITRVRPGLFF